MPQRLSIIFPVLLLLIFSIFLENLPAQTDYYYPLNNNFNEASLAADPLIVRPNTLGQTGQFLSRPLPLTTCAGLGVFDGYEYEAGASLEFRFPAGAAGCAYSIQFTWQYDNPIIPGSNPPQASVEWIKIFSFVYTDDSGFNIWTQAPSLNGTLYHWHLTPVIPGFPFCFPDFGALSPPDLFNTTDYYQMTFTRDCTNEIRTYVNGVQVGSFIDDDQRYVPQAPLNRIMFFRDTIDLSCYPTPFPGEITSGFVKDLVISDYTYTSTEVAADFLNFCPTVLELSWTLLDIHPSKLGREIQWSIDRVNSIERFELESGTDQNPFGKIGEIFPQPSAGTHEPLFSYLDDQFIAEKTYYRIKALDFDGIAYYSPILEVLPKLESKVFPNPFKDHIWVDIKAVQAEVEIYNLMGKIIHQNTYETGIQKIQLDEWPDGIYLIQIGNDPPKRLLKH
ncbi:MAG: T9SS type A sorting domain-containing protein [Bacteroidota bacterium]